VMKSLLFKISRRFNHVISIMRGYLYFQKTYVYIYNNVQIFYPETIIPKKNIYFMPYCRVQSGPNQSITLGNNVTVSSFTTIETAGGNIIIGDNVTIGEYSTLQGQGNIEIERNVLMASHVHLISNSHIYTDINTPIKFQENKSKKIHIKENSWIGINVVIQSGVSIGRNSVVGSNSTVRSDIPDFCVAVGNPAKVIKRFDFALNIWIKC